MVDGLFADSYLAGVYDLWHPREIRDDYDFYLPRIMAAESVLDLGCGTGTLLAEARDAGHRGRLCGVDPAPGMLDRARRRVDVEWVLADLPSAGFLAEFDLVVMTGHAFQAIIDDADLRRVMTSVQRALRPGGCFAFETRNPSARAWESWTSEYSALVRGPGGGEVRITTNVIAPFDGRTVSFTHTFTGPHHSLPQVSTSTLRFLDQAGVASLLIAAGMRIERQYGDFKGEEWSPTSPEIITIATR